MKILLIKDVSGIGRAGDIKEVSDGHGRNFLVPRGLAVIATNTVIQQVSKEQAEKKEKQAHEHEKHLKLKSQLENKIFTIKTKANKETLFAAVHESEIADSINRKLGLQIDPMQVIIPAPIKAIGPHQAEIKLEPDIKAVVNLTIEGI